MLQRIGIDSRIVFLRSVKRVLVGVSSLNWCTPKQTCEVAAQLILAKPCLGLLVQLFEPETSSGKIFVESFWFD